MIADAALVAEISGESEQMNPQWDALLYAAVDTFRTEQNKFERLKLEKHRNKD